MNDYPRGPSHAGTVMIKVRGDDVVRVRPITAKLAAIPHPDDLFVDKANRGWKSVHYCALASSGRKLILSEDWPVCLYDLKTAVPGQSMPGFLMSEDLLQAFRKSDRKRYVAQRAQLKKEVRLSSVTYVACLARFCLNSLTEWSDIDGADWSDDDFVRSRCRNLLTMEAELSELRSRLSAPQIAGETVPLEVHIACIERSARRIQEEKFKLRKASSRPQVDDAEN
ncbi:hypothetical protein OH76DRAFT_1422019 [Lentinus brumalis]|uniref:Uncharacterized protein n=1 Tax=Lentinus brumalis TaxID=2498619 RepID=A0A371CSM4_9APHY|nr:hypothetical protein OH76DRAFT_1422019 [Polyporus brumalis]